MSSLLAIHGGNPIRKTMLYYGKQSLDNEDKENNSEIHEFNLTE